VEVAPVDPSRLALVTLSLVTACALPTGRAEPAPDPELRQQEVRETELAFAATMTARDHAAFQTFLADDAIFVSGTGILRGKQAVAEGWAPLFEGAAPFAWEPDMVEVLASGDLALSSGPVTAPDGSLLGRFTSIWRRQADGWKVVFDKGDD
jgi:ketosteroid isomerase-like protein